MADDPDNYIKGYEHGFRDGWDASKKYHEELQSKSKQMTDEEKAAFDDLVEQI